MRSIRRFSCSCVSISTRKSALPSSTNNSRWHTQAPGGHSLRIGACPGCGCCMDGSCVGFDDTANSIGRSGCHGILLTVIICHIEKVTMSTLPACPQCQSEFTYEDGTLYICPECAHEWSAQASTDSAEDSQKVWRDAAGNILQDGDTVTVIKDLKLKGGGGVVKIGTKVKNIRLVEGDHDIDCKIDGFGAMGLKSEFVKKV